MFEPVIAFRVENTPRELTLFFFFCDFLWLFASGLLIYTYTYIWRALLQFVLIIKSKKVLSFLNGKVTFGSPCIIRKLYFSPLKFKVYVPNVTICFLQRNKSSWVKQIQLLAKSWFLSHIKFEKVSEMTLKSILFKNVTLSQWLDWMSLYIPSTILKKNQHLITISKNSMSNQILHLYLPTTGMSDYKAIKMKHPKGRDS